MKLSHAASTTLTAIAELHAPIGVGSGALLGGVLDIVNNIIQCLQYLVCVVWIAFGNDCNQLIELHPSASREISCYHLGVCNKPRNAIHENHRVMLESAAAGVHVPSTNLMSPSLNVRQERPLTSGSSSARLEDVGVITASKNETSLGDLYETMKPFIWVGSFLAGWWWYGYRHDRKPPNIRS